MNAFIFPNNHGCAGFLGTRDHLQGRLQESSVRELAEGLFSCPSHVSSPPVFQPKKRARSSFLSFGFAAAGVDLGFHEYAYPAYPQCFGDCVPFLSCLDMLSNAGLDAGTVRAAGRVLS